MGGGLELFEETGTPVYLFTERVPDPPPCSQLQNTYTGVLFAPTRQCTGVCLLLEILCE